MSLKRPRGDPGTLVVLEHDSKIQPFGDNQYVNSSGGYGILRGNKVI